MNVINEKIFIILYFKLFPQYFITLVIFICNNNILNNFNSYWLIN